ncbi:putative adhesin [Murinocardiopsis flavida]|uniref:Putative adhesin n=1 Tax=Murinocardiopsis flavida TaxID=645275 RepID=A0A2P8DMW3_9ACTN|nr:DUF4097 family beta strand repeat-containing protein [Murinocardiopsis flavida]PSK98552.1 putative adhesin [Murinocardiopsis flavida]
MTFTGRGLYAASSKVPRGRRVGWLAAGVLLGILAVCAGLVSGISMISTHGGTERDSFSGVATVVVENGTKGSIEVVGVGGDEVTVERSTRSPLGESADDSLRRKGGVLTVDAGCSGFRIVGGCAVDYTVKVPRGTELDLDAQDGAISVRGVEADVVADNTNGPLRLTGIEGDVRAVSVNGKVAVAGKGGTLVAESVNGGVDATGFTADDATVGSVNGSVSLGGGFTTASVETVTGKIRVSTGTPFKELAAKSTAGPVTLEVPDGTYRVTGESSLGERDIAVPTSPKADSLIDVDTTAGPVRIGLADR